MTNGADQYRAPAVSFVEIAGRLAERPEDLARRLLGEPNAGLSDRRQLRYGNHGSLVIELAGKKRGLWYDHEAGKGGGPFQLIERELGRVGAREWACAFLGIDGA